LVFVVVVVVLVVVRWGRGMWNPWPSTHAGLDNLFSDARLMASLGQVKLRREHPPYEIVVLSAHSTLSKKTSSCNNPLSFKKSCMFPIIDHCRSALAHTQGTGNQHTLGGPVYVVAGGWTLTEQEVQEVLMVTRLDLFVEKDLSEVIGSGTMWLMSTEKACQC
jgi:hypothetical protein